MALLRRLRERSDFDCEILPKADTSLSQKLGMTPFPHSDEVLSNTSVDNPQ